jgi:NOL1/NOP2/sun family putative RNA methylase
MTELPAAFVTMMKERLGPEWPHFYEALRRPPVRGVRLQRFGHAANPAASASDGLQLALAHATQTAVPSELRAQFLNSIPWYDDAFVLRPDSLLGHSVWIVNGACYIQEPSAMAVVPALDPQPGEWVLDLCAAPGGKATAIGRRMQGRGLLLANEVHPTRVRALVENLERAGIPACITQAQPDRLADALPQQFDAILVDAPCSGEGMFRKDPDARLHWSATSPEVCAARQRQILAHALRMLRPGGRLVYSTCTFNPIENEQVVTWALRQFPVELEDLPTWPGWEAGRPDWAGNSPVSHELVKTRRLWPHKGVGEGHFIARFRLLDAVSETSCKGSIRRTDRRRQARPRPLPRRADRRQTSRLTADWPRWLAELILEEHIPPVWRNPYSRGPQLYAVADGALVADLEAAGVHVVRPGLWLATAADGRYQPQHALAMALTDRVARHPLILDEGDAIRYLSGESLADSGQRGWLWVQIQGCPLGWAKGVAGRTNNVYPKGLRRTDLVRLTN